MSESKKIITEVLQEFAAWSLESASSREWIASEIASKLSDSNHRVSLDGYRQKVVDPQTIGVLESTLSDEEAAAIQNYNKRASTFTDVPIPNGYIAVDPENKLKQLSDEDKTKLKSRANVTQNKRPQPGKKAGTPPKKRNQNNNIPPKKNVNPKQKPKGQLFNKNNG